MDAYLPAIVAAVFGFVGLGAGYFLGYLNGKVAGELAAMKSMRHGSRRRFRESDDAQDRD